MKNQPQIRFYKLFVAGGFIYGHRIKEASIIIIDKKYYWQAVTDKNTYISTMAEDNLANAFSRLKMCVK